jgi:hypothetical protein
MPEPLTIIALISMGLSALNSTGLTLSYLLPWCTRRVKEESYDRKPYYIGGPGAMGCNMQLITLLRLTEKATRSQHGACTVDAEISHPGGVAILPVPPMRGSTVYDYQVFGYGTPSGKHEFVPREDVSFTLETLGDHLGRPVGVQIVWDAWERRGVEAFVAQLRERFDSRSVQKNE